MISTVKRASSHKKDITLATAPAHASTKKIKLAHGTTKIMKELDEVVVSVALSEDSTLCAAGTVAAYAVVFTTATGTEVSRFRLSSGVNAVSFLGTGDYTSLVAGSFGGVVYSFYSGYPLSDGSSPRANSDMSVQFGEGQCVYCVATALGGTRLCAGGKAGLVTVYIVELRRAAAARLTEAFRFEAVGEVLSIAVDSSFTILATGGDQKVLQLWTLPTVHQDEMGRTSVVDALFSSVGQFACRAQIHSVSLTGDGSMLAVGTSENTEVYLLHSPPRDAPARPTLRGRASSLRRTSSAKGSMSLLRAMGAAQSMVENAITRPLLPTPAPAIVVEPLLLLELPAHQGGVAFAAKGSILVVGGGFQTTVLSLRTGGSLFSMKQSGRVRCVALTPDGEFMALGGFDKVASVYAVGSGAETHVIDAALSNPTGEMIYTASSTDANRDGSSDASASARDSVSTTNGEPPTIIDAETTEAPAMDGFSSGEATPVARRTRWRVGPGRSPAGARASEVNTSFGRRFSIGRQSSEQSSAGELHKWGTRKRVEVPVAEPSAPPKAQRAKRSEIRPTTVRSVHMSADCKWLAVGCDNGRTGKVKLYNAASSELLNEWEHPKAVWVVRLSSDGSLLASAGYDCKLTVYAAHRPIEVAPAVVSFDEDKGPAFVWTCNFSANDQILCTGCWNATASMYSVETTLNDVEELVAIKLTLVGLVHRSDRVYATDVDGEGKHMLVGGRDKRVALYRVAEEQRIVSFNALAQATRQHSAPTPEPVTPPPAAEGGSKKISMCRWSKLANSSQKIMEKIRKEPTMVWEVPSEDFVYSVTLSHDLSHAAFGGTARSVVVLDGRSGAKMFELSFPSTVWTVQLAIASSPPRHMLAIGGESPTLSVIDVGSRQVELELPVQAELYSVCLASTCLAYNSQGTAQVYGASNLGFAWHDRPSFNTMTKLIRSLVYDERTLLRCIGAILQRHPTVVNTTRTWHRPEVGPTLLHWVVQHTSSQRLLELMLQTKCWLAMSPDAQLRTVLDPALEVGRSALLLNSLTAQRFLPLPGPTQMITKVLPLWAGQFPSEFLHLIAHFPLQPEPEILGGDDTQGVLLPHRLIRGSEWRCPRHLWAEDLQQFSLKNTNTNVKQKGSPIDPVSEETPMRVGPFRILPVAISDINDVGFGVTFQHPGRGGRYVIDVNARPLSNVLLPVDGVQMDSIDVGVGMLSPGFPVTLSPADKVAAKIPEASAHFAFGYPLPTVCAKPDADLSDPRALCCLVGFFVYMDAKGQVIGVSALSSGPGLHFTGPDSLQALKPRLRATLYEQERVMPVTFADFLNRGIEGFCWVGPGEAFSSDSGCREDVLSHEEARDAWPHGAFLYLYGSDMVHRDCYFAVTDAPQETIEQARREQQLGQAVPDGFSRAGLGGVEAKRVGFEGFAGHEGSGGLSPLQLVLNAVQSTNDFGVFNAAPLKILLDFKWNAFAEKVYVRLCLIKTFDFLVAISYRMTATNYVGLTLDELARESAAFFVAHTVGWMWTTTAMLRREVPDAIAAVRHLPKQTFPEQMFTLLSAAVTTSNLLTSALVLYTRTIKGAIVQEGWMTEKQMKFMHAVAILTDCGTTVVSFRGFLRFGALIHLVMTVIVDIVPFLSLLSIVMLGFTLSLKLVTESVDGTDELWDRYSFWSSIATSIDMGLYAATISPEAMHEPTVLAFYFPYMIVVQVVLLNLLIAIMGSSHTTIGNDAALVARYQRARLIVRLEQAVKWKPFDSSRYLGALFRGLRSLFFPTVKEKHICPKWLHVLTPTTHDIDELRLLSDNHGSSVGSTSPHLDARLDALQRAVEEMSRRLDQLPNELAERGRSTPRELMELRDGQAPPA